jgi:hypothetical protein
VSVHVSAHSTRVNLLEGGLTHPAVYALHYAQGHCVVELVLVEVGHLDR